MGTEIVDVYLKILVANYLHENGYSKTLAHFCRDSGVTPQAGAIDAEHESLRDIVRERMEFNEQALTQRLRDLALYDTRDAGTISPAPPWDHTRKIRSRRALDEFVGSGALVLDMQFDAHGKILAITTNKREIALVDLENWQLLAHNTPAAGSSALRSVARKIGFIQSKYVYTCAMDGSLALFDHSLQPASHDPFQLHDRVITFIKVIEISGTIYFVSNGLDNLLKIHTLSSTDNMTLRKLAEIKLTSPCSALVAYQDSQTITICLSKSHSTHVSLYNFSLRSKELMHYANIALNSGQFSTHAFDIRDMTLTKYGNKKVIAVTTSHQPYMRIILADIPPITQELRTYYDKILRNIATNISQDSLSTPVVQYSEFLNGLLVGADEGIYAIDLHSAKSWLFDDSTKRLKCLVLHSETKQMTTSSSNKENTLTNFE